MADVSVPLVDQRAERLLELAVGPGTPARLIAAMELYERSDARLVGLRDGDELFGVVGFSHGRDEVRILHLAVQSEVRAQGFGRLLVDWLACAYPDHPLVRDRR